MQRTRRPVNPPLGRRLSQLVLARGALTGRAAIFAAAARRDASPHRFRSRHHFTTSQWPVCLLPSRRMILLATRIPIAVVTVVFEKPSFVANPRNVILGSCTNSLYTCFTAAGKSCIKLGSPWVTLGSLWADWSVLGRVLVGSWSESV